MNWSMKRWATVIASSLVLWGIIVRGCVWLGQQDWFTDALGV